MIIRLHLNLRLQNSLMLFRAIQLISGLMKHHFQLKCFLASMLKSCLEHIKFSQQLSPFFSYCSIDVVGLLIPKLKICVFVVKMLYLFLVFLTFEVISLYLFEVICLSLTKQTDLFLF